MEEANENDRLSHGRSRESGVLGLSGILIIVYLVIGVVVAQANGYVENLRRIRGIISLILAVVLWPLVVLGVDLHIGRL